MNKESKEEIPTINSSLFDSSAKASAGSAESGNDSQNFSPKLKMVLMAIGGGVILIILILLIVGTVQSFVYRSDNNDLTKQIEEKNKLIKELTDTKEKNEKTIESLRSANEVINQKNAYYKANIKIKDEVIDELKGKVAEKIGEIEALKEAIKKKEELIEVLERKIEVLKDEIEDLKDDVDKLYSDMRFIVGLTNQELNRNQNLEKEIDYLEDVVKQKDASIGNLTYEIFVLKEEIFTSAINWVKYSILEKATKNKVNLKLIYNGTRKDCSVEEFYKKASVAQPNVFIATEAPSGLMFGGYTKANWTRTKSNFTNDPDAFTFSATYRETCENTNPEKAIFNRGEKGGMNYLLGFGEHDILIGNDCINKKSHNITSGPTYKCPVHKDNPLFYTKQKNPVLSNFKFYEIEIEKLSDE